VAPKLGIGAGRIKFNSGITAIYQGRGAFGGHIGIAPKGILWVVL
jgi:hypothetical protein